MKTLSQRLSRFFLVLFVAQLCALGVGLLLSYLMYQSRIVRDAANWARLDPLVTEELIAFTVQDNRAARDFLVYELVLRNQLSHASVQTPEQMRRTISTGEWSKACNPELQSKETVCERSSGALAAFVPLEHGGKRIAYFVKETLRSKVVSAHFSEFSKYLLLTLVACGLFNLVGVYFYFRTTIDQELKRVFQLLSEIRSPSFASFSLPFETKEFAMMQDVLKESANAIEQTKLEKAQSAADNEKARVAFQVAHDIKSPLAALEVALHETTKLPEQERVLIRSAVHRIRDIASALLRDARERHPQTLPSITGNVDPVDLGVLTEALVSEKRLEYRAQSDVKIETSGISEAAFGVFAKVDAPGLKRVLSNLINNAVEALESGGLIEVSVEGEATEARIRVKDTGRGMPADLVRIVGLAAIRGSKPGGHGLGLMDAAHRVKEWGGRLFIEPAPVKGTEVTIFLPRAESPPWFVPSLKIDRGMTIAVVDDDDSIHAIWRKRFTDLNESAGTNVSLVHFRGPSEFELLRKRATGPINLYLVDYEFISSQENGLDFIERFGISSASKLITSHFEESSVVARCRALGVGMIPKGMAGFIRLRAEDSSPPKVVLIDDDILVRTAWKLSLSRQGVALETYASPADFEMNHARYPRSVRLYIDFELGTGKTGADFATEYAQKGFSEIYLTTGHTTEALSANAHVKGVVGKMPPTISSPI